MPWYHCSVPHRKLRASSHCTDPRYFSSGPEGQAFIRAGCKPGQLCEAPPADQRARRPVTCAWAGGLQRPHTRSVVIFPSVPLSFCASAVTVFIQRWASLVTILYFVHFTYFEDFFHAVHLDYLTVLVSTSYSASIVSSFSKRLFDNYLSIPLWVSLFSLL